MPRVSSPPNRLTDAIAKADVLIEALEYIRRFRDRYVVIKLGGSALDEPEAVRACLTDVLFMSSVGMRPIVVHGGGKAISRAMAEAGIEPNFVQGRRYTDDRTLAIATTTLAGIAEDLADQLNSLGGRAVALYPPTTSQPGTEAVLVGRRLSLPSADGPVDLGCVGEVVDVRRDTLAVTCRSGTIPVIPCFAVERTVAGETVGLLNVNGDTAAAAVARLLRVEKLVFLSDVPGIQRDRDDPATLISHLPKSTARELIETGIIDGGMIPKVDASLEAIDAGVRKVHMVDASQPHGLLIEIFSDEGVGTEITA